MSENCRRIIIDVDCGIDDAYAIALFLYAEKLKKIKIEAITLTRGNTSLDHVARNVVRLLELFNRTNIPVYKGSGEPLILPPETQKPPKHFGLDGFSDLTHKTEPNLALIQPIHASLAIHDIVINNPGEITLVCLAPLTNIALTLKIFEDFSRNVKEIFMMGGNYTGIGNITASAEFNVYCDPEAAAIVLQSFKCPITVFVLEAGALTSIDINWRFDVLGEIKNGFMTLMNEAERKHVGSRTIRQNIWFPYDAFLAAAIIFPEIILRTNTYHASIELSGLLTRGLMVLDHLKTKEPNITVIEKIDDKNFANIMLEVLQKC